MGVAIDFQGTNLIMKPPKEAEDRVNTLYAFTNGATIVSCWKFSPQELIEIARTGRVFLAVMGSTHPPVVVGSEDEVRSVIADYGDVWKRK